MHRLLSNDLEKSDNYILVTNLVKRKQNTHFKQVNVLFAFKLSYAINIFKSSSTFVMPPIPKFSTKTLTTFGERNAGSVGPK